MSTTGWTWAELSGDQLQIVALAEQTLGADYLLVYRPAASSGRGVVSRVRSLQAAPLTESQLECLHGLEAQLQAIVVAYTDKP